MRFELHFGFDPSFKIMLQQAKHGNVNFEFSPPTQYPLFLYLYMHMLVLLNRWPSLLFILFSESLCNLCFVLSCFVSLFTVVRLDDLADHFCNIAIKVFIYTYINIS